MDNSTENETGKQKSEAATGKFPVVAILKNYLLSLLKKPGNKNPNNIEPEQAPLSTMPAFSSSSVWKSKISWRIALTVLVTIIIVQIGVLFFTIDIYEHEMLEELEDTVHAALVPALNDIKEQYTSPMESRVAERLIKGTPLKGIAIYGLDYSLITLYGEKPSQRILQGEPIPEDVLTENKKYYEVTFRPSEIEIPYYIIVKADAHEVNKHLQAYIDRSLYIFLLMACFVSSVLMLALSQWLLEPMILLRNNLLSAARNPENPDIRLLKREMTNEIGIAIRVANDLIRQNAGNLKRLRTQAEDKIHKLAYFDTLTGLPNRTYFLEKLDENIKNKVIRDDARLAVISVDIDHFKDINDTMGHEVGDKLLDAIGKRIVKSLPENSIVSRAGADEFTVMAFLSDGHPDSSIIIERIFTSMIEPVSILQERFQVRVSIGVTHCPEDGTDARQILKNADIALNRAKEEGRDTVRYYSQDFDAAIQQRFQLLRDLRIAMDQKQLRLHYHPQFDLKTGHLIGAEALLRWWLPDGSKEGGRFISPVDFIPIAEQSGLIVPIGEYVLKTALSAHKKWQQKGLPPIRIAVNISGVQFHRGDIVNLVSSMIKEEGIDPRFLELEITESVFMENIQVAIDILNQLHALGVELAVDDFGTGYSSLSYLRQFPIDRLKVDQSFTRNALTNPDDRAITKTIIALGHALGLKVIAEGVETAEHENFLKEEGCDESQGFKYTIPIPEDAFFEFAINHNRELAKNSGLKVVEKEA